MERRSIAVQGIVQGVGFRPFVHALARRLCLAGFVKNRAGDVLIEVEGESAALEHFLARLTAESPPLARIEKIACHILPTLGEQHFTIHPSVSSQGADIFVSVDVATCAHCLKEMGDPKDRRFRYPFINCTQCGPRLTIITGAPYDRPQTTMAGFAMCEACRAEYSDPGNRRFHAEPICCPECGPTLHLLDGGGRRVFGDPIQAFAKAILGGGIGALKGLGGYHLACDARSEAAVAALRRRKLREEKPFALMVGDVATAASLCVVPQEERALLESRRRPIVLLNKREPCPIADAVAPGNPALGVMLPYAPLHHLLLEAVGGIPLVMTSGNRADEPIAYEDADALERLKGIADCFLTHNRPIHVRCDDSVTRIVVGRELPIRRSRGYAPEPITLPMECPAPILAVGGQLKGAFALGRGQHAFVSHHLGDLDHLDAYRAFVKDIALYETLFDVRPRLIVHDLHPDYASTRYAKARAAAEDILLLAVQHHHAHMASCMAEHGLTGPVIGVSFDGTGFGTDGAVWGGEFLVGDYGQFRRAAHLRYVGMPGGEQAIREPWRMALAHLRDAGLDSNPLHSCATPAALRVVEQMLERGFNTPMTSSAGRLFDAVAALVLQRGTVSFEGQAAMQLEWLAGNLASDTTYPWALDDADDEWIIDTRRLVCAVAADVRDGADGAAIARRFHASIADIIASTCGKIREQTGVNAVTLSGGVFMNVRLTREASDRLSGMGFAVYRHHQVPPNDGGLGLGQLAIAATWLAQTRGVSEGSCQPSLTPRAGATEDARP